MVDIIAITAISGILIGAMNLTGVAFSLTQQLLTLSGGNLALLLIITAFAAFVLGLPLPTLGVYVILATLAAPALVQAGISPMQAHMFVLFNGMLGMVTPPVALAAFAAATIAHADQWKTGWTATRMSWCAYFIPFLFAYTPALVMRGDRARDPCRRWPSSCSASSWARSGWSASSPGTVPVAYRIAYGVIAVMLLAQPAMFDGRHVAQRDRRHAAAAAIAREVVRGRAAAKLAPPQTLASP